jgi:hypothetical protein
MTENRSSLGNYCTLAQVWRGSLNSARVLSLTQSRQ